MKVTYSYSYFFLYTTTWLALGLQKNVFFIFAVLKHVFYFLKPFFSVFYGFLFQNSEIEINGFSCHPQTRNSNEVPNIPHGHMFHGIHRENVYFLR